MTSFSYVNNIPASGNNPSIDQPNMQMNTASALSIWTQDHVTFNAANGGTHLQQTYAGFSPGAVLSNDTASTAYPAAGVTNTAIAQYWFSNSQSDFVLSCVKAFGSVTTIAVNGPQTVNPTSWNVMGVNRTGVGNYVVTLTPKSVYSVTYIVLTNSQVTPDFGTISSGASSYGGYNIIGTPTVGTFQLNFKAVSGMGGTDPKFFSFVVLEI